SLDTTAHASWTLSKRTVDVTSSRSGAVPFFARRAERAIAKQLACAAASSSSGLVLPSGASVRAAHETGSAENFELEIALTSPEPLARSPCQTAFACRVAAIDSPFSMCEQDAARCAPRAR